MKNKILKSVIVSFILLGLVTLLGQCKKKGPKECLHEHIDWVVLNDSTCVNTGTKQQVCSDCKKVFTTAIINLKNHTVVDIKSKEPTCEETGLTSGSYCSVCNEIIVEQEILPATGHHYELDKDLSNDEKLVYVCSCNDSYEIDINGNEICEEHNPGEFLTVKEATCTEFGEKQLSCTVCKTVLEVQLIPLADHHEVVDKEIEATCEKDGLSEGSHCDKCNKILSKQEVVPAIGHNYVITKTLTPSQFNDGYIEYTCQNCLHSYQDVITADDYNPTLPTTILLSNNGIIVNNNNGGVLIENNQVLITLAGEYDLSGTINEGNIVVRVNEEDNVVLNLQGVNITSSNTHPIYIESGNEIDISAKSGTKNYLYDKRVSNNTDVVGAVIYSKVDLDIKGKGELYIESTYNNGIGSTKDLNIKNLTLYVNVPNNSLKGNDSLTIESGTITAISSSNDALKTENSDISEKGNQRGIITILDGTLNLYAACDGIDASYDVIINGGTINIYTEKYSSYSGDVSVTEAKTLYLRLSSRTGISNSNYTFSALFTDENNQSAWASGTIVSSSQSKYYKFEIPSNAVYVKIYGYNSQQSINNTTDYSCYTDQLTIPTAYDTYYATSVSNKRLSGNWQNYSQGQQRPGVPGGPMEGNPDSALYSCKGIKADNELTINGGTITIKSHDDAVHANSDVLLNTSVYGKGNVYINGGTLNITTDDDGLHADGTLIVNGGNVIINTSYEGVEGNSIYFKGGRTQIKSSDDGVNAKTTLYFQDGIVYLDAGGDGIDSNGNVYMSGGIVLAVGPSNGGNGVIDIGDRGYSFSFTGGLLLAIGASGMDVAPTASSGNTSSASRVTSSLNSYLTITSNGEIIAVLKVNKSNQTYRVFAYNNKTYPSATLTSSSSTSVELVNGLYYAKNN